MEIRMLINWILKKRLKNREHQLRTEVKRHFFDCLRCQVTWRPPLNWNQCSSAALIGAYTKPNFLRAVRHRNNWKWLRKREKAEEVVVEEGKRRVRSRVSCDNHDIHFVRLPTKHTYNTYTAFNAEEEEEEEAGPNQHKTMMTTICQRRRK